MKYLLLTLSILLLSSCGQLTVQEIEEAKKVCAAAGQTFVYDDSVLDSYYCKIDYESPSYKVQKCIDGFINSIDEKYNNPDTVSNLREDEYSNVVKTCNETFGNHNQ